MTASISIKGLHHTFGAFQALKNIDLSIDAGEYTVLLGPSGCGKTTLLSILGGFLVPTQGLVMIGEKDMTQVQPAKRPTTTMFQDYALFPHMSLKDNVAFGLRMRGMRKQARHAKADQFLELVGLFHDGNKRPHELSGGQRQRVALARALAVNPDVLLLDEPLGALDLKLRRSMQDELKAIQREVGTTFVHVTHDQEEAMAIADRIVVMNAGQIEDQGAPDRVYRRPCSLFAANFMGEINQIPAWREQNRLATLLGHPPIAPPDSDAEQWVACVRPEQLSSEPREWSLGTATVVNNAFFGAHYRCHLRSDKAPNLTFVAHFPPSHEPKVGESLALYVDPQHISLFADTHVKEAVA
ncbi:ABC transporter ATP-binding protein [Vreelandella arcis]|uniref:Spermidine/putrescine transport system ATP-binding protein n=1 Tax=Vreelandella arcis TaxID=416873 RepID=A0A1G9YS57_9GAMM|nr:ABC transporter ATP-binding protein [Halomonas arcis]SDN11787.1 spermidine/putrescine transport system ATP-binding protein [Halomonas arcis]